MDKLKRVVIKEELVELTCDFRKALILNQFIYWSERVKDHDKWIKEEKERAKVGGINIDILESKGWIYKTAEELNEELMMGLNIKTLRKLLKELIQDGYINERRNPKYKWDKTLQYRVDLVKVQTELLAKGYCLEGYPMLTIENKKASNGGTKEASQKSINNNYNSIICNNDNNNTSKTESKVEKIVTETEKVINSSCVNIKEKDMKECIETFTDIDRLKKALSILEAKNSHGIKALKLAYKDIDKVSNGNNKVFVAGGNAYSKYSEEELLRMNQRKHQQKIIEHKFV